MIIGEVADGLLESAMSTAQIGQDTYGLALNTNTKILFYNVKGLRRCRTFCADYYG
ncbi:MAG: hypothetical protein ACLTUL_02305 [Blautia faecis]